MYRNLSLPTASTDVNPPLVTTAGTSESTPAFSVFYEKDPSWPRTILQYQSITAMPAYKSSSSEVGESTHPGQAPFHFQT
ncbi:hypothetical protein OG21DRAFT_1509311 [Imleria badia]|nr:hypothetical protein OG21DRAFT_1509311 [Imleria badia]